MVDVESLNQVPIFSSLDRDDLRELAELCRAVRREDQQLVFRQGDIPDAMYLVQGGRVAISVWTEDNEELVLATLADGEFFGELGLLDGSPRTATAKALGPVELIEIRKDELLAFLRRNPEAALSMMGEIARRLRGANALIERRASRNVNELMEETFTFGDRLADRIAQFGGSWAFLICFAITLCLWMGLNSLEAIWHPFDPYPFIFLNLILSCLAAVQAPIIMMSQNRQATKDRLQADLDYQVNLKAELQIRSLHLKIDELRASELRDFVEIQREQLTLQRQQMEILKQLASSS
jgi:CRP/FNR family transcriptional regulator, cyclic AMP receptor protein